MCTIMCTLLACQLLLNGVDPHPLPPKPNLCQQVAGAAIIG